MISAGFYFLAIGTFALAPAALSKSNILVCKVQDFHAHAPPSASMIPLIGKNVILDDHDKTIVVKIPDRDPEVFAIVSRRNDWLLRAQSDGGTILSVVSLPEYQGLTMFLVFSRPTAGKITVTLKGRCTESG